MLGLADGRERWSYEIGEPVASSPAVAGGMVFVGCDDGGLYAFGE
jgi:outer membrane protein assembly factor BamB